VKSIYNKYKKVFLVTYFVSLCVYAYTYINEIANPDKYFYREYYIAGDWEISLGRFFTQFIDQLGYGIKQSIITSVFVLAVFTLCSIFLCEILEVERKWTAFVIALLFVTSPKIMATLTCYYCSDAYSIAYLCICIAIYLVKQDTRKFKFGLLKYSGIFFIAIALGIYQAVIGALATLSFILVLLCILREDKDILPRIRDIFIINAAGVLLYYILMKLALKIYNLKMPEYRGIGNFSILNILQHLPKTFVKTYQEFYQYFFGSEIYVNSYQLIRWNILLFGLVVLTVLALFMIKGNRLYQIAAVVLLLLLPAVTAVMDLIIPETSIDTLQTDGFILVLPLFIRFIEYTLGRLSLYKPNFKKLLKGGVITGYFFALIISFKYILITNTDAVALQFSTRQSIEVGRRILKDFEDGHYFGKYKLDIIGVTKDGNYPIPDSLNYNTNRDGKLGIMWGGTDSTILWNGLLRYELGVQTEMDSKEIISEIAQSQVFMNAPCYPEEGSLFVVGDSVVVKVSSITP